MTGADWPGKSAVHSGFFGSIELGRPFSADVPFWFGPRQASQPFTAAVEERESEKLTAATRKVTFSFMTSAC